MKRWRASARNGDVAAGGRRHLNYIGWMTCLLFYSTYTYLCLYRTRVHTTHTPLPSATPFWAFHCTLPPHTTRCTLHTHLCTHTYLLHTRTFTLYTCTVPPHTTHTTTPPHYGTPHTYCYCAAPHYTHTSAHSHGAILHTHCTHTVSCLHLPHPTFVAKNRRAHTHFTPRVTHLPSHTRTCRIYICAFHTCHPTTQGRESNMLPSTVLDAAGIWRVTNTAA